MSCLVLGLSTPRPGNVTIATLDPLEENASVTAALLGNSSRVTRISFVSPSPGKAEEAVSAACIRLHSPLPREIGFSTLTYGALLRAYSRSEQTYSTHVLLPGIDPTRKRRHVHLTHGSGPKPDRTFRGPTNVLASIVDIWAPAQLQDYRLPKSTPVLPVMPRLEVMRRAADDRTVISRLGLDERKKLVVWAPTYRSIRRAGGETRVSGRPFSDTSPQSGTLNIDEIRKAVEEHDCHFIAKVHPFDVDSYQHLNVRSLTSADLQSVGVTSYELFGAADLLITDYSSVFTERAALGLPFRLYCPDSEEFAASYRGFREPDFRHPTAPVRLATHGQLRDLLTTLSTTGYRVEHGREVANALGIERLDLGGPLTVDNLFEQVETAWR